MDKKIAVLLPHYNNHNGLKLTLDSLLNESQLLTLFLIDDGSDEVDSVESVVSDYNNKLDIRFIKNENNLGIVKTLNKGLKIILDLNKFDLIARIDAGDISLSNRFSKQKQMFLKDNDLGLVASWVRFVDVNRKRLFDFKPPTDHSKLKKVIHLYNPFVHPSVMCRTEVINKLGLYTEKYPCLEDHAYFIKIIRKYKTKVLDEILLEYEINPKGLSITNRKAQTKSRIKLLLAEYKFGFYPTIGLIRAVFTHIASQRLLILIKQYLYK